MAWTPRLVRLYNEHYVTIDPLVRPVVEAPFFGTLVDSEEMFCPTRWWHRGRLR